MSCLKGTDCLLFGNSAGTGTSQCRRWVPSACEWSFFFHLHWTQWTGYPNQRSFYPAGPCLPLQATVKALSCDNDRAKIVLLFYYLWYSIHSIFGCNCVWCYKRDFFLWPIYEDELSLSQRQELCQGGFLQLFLCQTGCSDVKSLSLCMGFSKWSLAEHKWIKLAAVWVFTDKIKKKIYTAGFCQKIYYTLPLR